MSFLVHKSNPLFHNVAQLGIDVCLRVAVTAGTNNAGTLPDKALILVIGQFLGKPIS